MKIMKKLLSVLLSLTMTLSIITAYPIEVNAANADLSSYISDLIAYYRDYQDEAQTDIDRILDEMAAIDEEQAIVWDEIMDYWAEVNTEGFANIGSVPEGLVNDDTLAVVILGFALNDDGTMKEELVGRLQTGLDIANAYPNSYVVVTGGGTAANNPDVTEGGLMGEWLLEQGLSADRLIVENRAPDTVGNAENTYAILAETYPQVDKVVLVTSDYHVPRGCLLYNSKFILEAYENDGEPLTIVANGGYSTGTNGYETIALQSRGLASVAGVTASTSVELSKVIGLKVTQNTMYTTGNDLDLTVEAVYNTGYSNVVTDLVNITNFDKTLDNTQTITVTYEENGVTISGEFTLNTESKEIADMSSINTLVEEAKAYEEASYTKTTYATLQETIAYVEEELTKELTIEEVNALYEELQFAVSTLRKRLNLVSYYRNLSTTAETVADKGITAIADNDTSTYGTFGPDITNLDIIIELDGYYDLDEIVVRPYHSTKTSDNTVRSYFYDLYISEDGENWEFVTSHTDTGTKAEGNSHLVNSELDAKYIKITGTGKVNPGNQTNMSFHLSEVYAYGEETKDILLGKKFTSSGADTSVSSSATATTVKALDGDRTTYWDAGSYKNNPWIIVDLDGIYKLDMINVINYYKSARYYQYEIYVSLDGVDYVKVAEKTDDATSTVYGTQFDINGEWYAKYIKVVGTYHSRNSAFHINELRAYGTLATDEDQAAIEKQVQVQERAGLLDTLLSYYRSDYTGASWDEFYPEYMALREKADNEDISLAEIEQVYVDLAEAAKVLVKGNPDIKTEDAFRVASFNIWAPNPNHPDVENILEQLLRCEIDYAGIQEVDRNNTRDNRDIINLIADEYYESSYQKAIDYKNGEYGIGQLSSTEILETSGGNYTKIDSEEGRAWQRMLVEIDGKEVAIYNTHLSTGRAEAFYSNQKELIEVLNNDTTPYKIVTGDFNASRELMDPFKENYNLANGNDGIWYSTFEGDSYADGAGYLEGIPSADVESGIDNMIYTRNLEISNFRVVYGHGNSDHYMIYADFVILAYEEDLQELIDAHTYTADIMTEESYVAYEEALNEAKALLENTDYSQLQDELKEAYDKLSEAIDLIVFVGADYSAVDAQIAIAEAIDQTYIRDFSAVTAAINAVDRSLNITKQAEVDAMAEAIETAIAELEVGRIIEIERMEAEAGDSQSGEGADMAIDNNTNTMWHTNWNGSERDSHYFIVTLDKITNINGLKVLNRQNNQDNGSIAKFDLYVRISEEADWTLVLEDATLDSSSKEWQTVDFDAVDALQVKLQVKDSAEDPNQPGVLFSSMAEFRLYETGEYAEQLADYTAVKAAIKAAEALNADYYVDFSAVDAAVEAVVYGLRESAQAEVDAYAKAIEDAIDALELKDADYSKVEAAKAKVPADLSIYTEESVAALNAAIEAVVEGLKADEQAKVDGYAKAIEKAINNLDVIDADYSELDEVLTKVPEDLSIYTDETVKALQDALDAVEEDLDITEQEKVEEYVKAIEEAIEALELKDADYTEIEELLEVVNGLVKDLYENFEIVEEAVAAIVKGLDITKQSEVDAMADKIAEALANLKVKEETEVPDEDDTDPTPDTDEEDPTPVKPEKPEENEGEGESSDENVNTSDVTPIFGFIAMLVLAAVSFLFTRKED